MKTLPYITPLELSIGGSIKDEPSHFIVEEIPLYEPEGQGQHIYLLIKKTDLNTSDVEKSLATLFDISDKDIGTAGMKDKRAITTQWFSLSLGANSNTEEVCKKINENISGIEILKSSKHVNKLKTGHLIANKFTITISDIKENALVVSKEIISLINKNGLPNFYGHQRFGSKGDNAITGKEIILGNKKIKKHWLKKIFLSAYQSELFNIWLTQRIEDGLFNELVPGDILLNSDGGRSFPFDIEKTHLEEFNKNDITYTGPMFGSKVSPAKEEEKVREDNVFNAQGISLDQLKNVKLQGTRRAARIFPKDITIKEPLEDNSITLSFTLPVGSYATILLREFTKNF
ncbi:tRNA pseudouridine(13) synthase TruD [Halobacteriovorax sp.]|uniref:tRNA pseudouridine(13) synthase TruD n=1 Tax=Halobacteriovorax sp. TaxID=2020862 RepID=UPI0035660AE8